MILAHFGVHLVFKFVDLDLIASGVLSPKLGEAIPDFPTLLQRRCAAGVNPPLPTRGLLGNFGTGLASTFPVMPA